MRFLWIAVVSVLAMGHCSAAVPGKVNYQGKLTDTSGKLVSDGSYDMVFSLYDAASGGKALQVSLNKRLISQDAFRILASPAVETPEPGLYRATVRMKVQGMMNTLGSGVRIRAGDMNGRTVYMNEFDEEDAYQEFTLDFEVREGDIVARPTERFLTIAQKRLKCRGSI